MSLVCFLLWGKLSCSFKLLISVVKEVISSSFWERFFSVCLSFFLKAYSRLRPKNMTITAPSTADINIIKAFGKFSNENTCSRLILMGDGPLKEDIENTIKKLNLEDKVILTGFIDNVTDYLLFVIAV